VKDLKRYSLGTKNRMLQFAADGSLTIYLQKDRPADDLVSNWLPAPTGAFPTTLRAYWPDEQLVKGTWLPPAIEKLQGPKRDLPRSRAPAADIDDFVADLKQPQVIDGLHL